MFAVSFSSMFVFLKEGTRVNFLAITRKTHTTICKVKQTFLFIGFRKESYQSMSEGISSSESGPSLSTSEKRLR
ncbi:hypothetical protein QKD39_gp01 [Psittacine adenovirus 1]|uniref:Uncharacterized protein n=1 Tax=Psittacine adenovirus 1 TaxID=318592 RepID=A0A2Z5E1B5_9ADEN|nr:hypothetical protein QKD39_gp01 [Psittacine adenovirus 1]AXB73020.1 hypothetical protein [Psittacine adenovirus 1]